MSTDENTNSNHGYSTPSEGQTDWHVPINENFRQIDTDVEVRDTEGNLSEYDPVANAKFLATDTGRTFIGDGSNWSPLPAVGTSTPDIVCYEDGNKSYAETTDKTFTGADIFAAAQQAADARLAEFDRPGGNSDSDPGPGNIHILLEPDVYEVSTGLSFVGNDDERYQGVESFTIESPNRYGAYIRTAGIDSEPAIHIDPGVDDTVDASDRWRGVEMRNLFFDNGDQKRTFEKQSSASRDITAIEVAQVIRVSLENIEARYYKQGLNIRNCWEGEVNYFRPTSCGDSDSGTAAILVEKDTNFSTAAPGALNHICFNNLLGGNGCEEVYFRATSGVEKCTINHPSLELGNCPGFDLSTPNMIVSDGQISGAGPHFTLNGNGDFTITGGRYNADAEFLRAGADGNRAEVQVSNLKVIGDPSHDVFEVFDAHLHLDNCDINRGLRGIEVGDESAATYDGSGPNPFNIQISNTTIRNTEETGVYLARNNKRYRWKVSNCEVSNACQNGNGNPIVVDADNVDVKDCSVQVNGGVSPRVGVKDDNYNADISINGLTAGGSPNLSSLTNSPAQDSTVRQNSGTVTVSSGESAVSVAHQLSEVPDPHDITVVPNGPLGAASNWHLGTIGSDTFVINLDANPTQDVEFAWQAEL